MNKLYIKNDDKNITLFAGYEDYHMALKTLEENLAETGDRVVEISAKDKVILIN